jgi:hypothetical protein
MLVAILHHLWKPDLRRLEEPCRSGYSLLLTLHCPNKALGTAKQIVSASARKGCSSVHAYRKRIDQVEALGVLGQDRREHAGDNVPKFRGVMFNFLQADFSIPIHFLKDPWQFALSVQRLLVRSLRMGASPAIRLCTLFDAYVGEVRLAIAEPIRKPKLCAFSERNFESALPAMAEHMALVDNESINFSVPEIGEYGRGSKALCRWRLRSACRQ